MAEADAKMTRRALRSFTAIFAGLLLCWVIPFPVDSIVGFAHHYFTQAATGWKITAFISIAAHFIFLWKYFPSVSDIEEVGSKGGKTNALLFGWFVLNVLLMSGFNFDLPY
jgi:hypothetical protein